MWIIWFFFFIYKMFQIVRTDALTLWILLLFLDTTTEGPIATTNFTTHDLVKNSQGTVIIYLLDELQEHDPPHVQCVYMWFSLNSFGRKKTIFWNKNLKEDNLN